MWVGYAFVFIFFAIWVLVMVASLIARVNTLIVR